MKRTNVPDIAMSFSDSSFSYGPFVPHYVPRQYIENYFSTHKTDEYLSLGTTVEDLTQLPAASRDGLKTWKLTLRKYDRLRHVDVWWQEEFDAVILANGHYSVPWVLTPIQSRDSILTIRPGSTGSRLRGIHGKVPWQSGTLQILPVTMDICQ